ncbi:MAG TPA: hypothetical protein VF508_12105, partial [Pyrinomonadaceae bacterium]
MFRKYLPLALAVLLFNAAGAGTALAGRGQGSQAGDAAKVKAAVAKFGVGKSARVVVRMFDGTKVKGYVKVTREEDFVVERD